MAIQVRHSLENDDRPTTATACCCVEIKFVGSSHYGRSELTKFDVREATREIIKASRSKGSVGICLVFGHSHGLADGVAVLDSLVQLIRISSIQELRFLSASGLEPDEIAAMVGAAVQTLRRLSFVAHSASQVQEILGALLVQDDTSKNTLLETLAMDQRGEYVADSICQAMAQRLPCFPGLQGLSLKFRHISNENRSMTSLVQAVVTKLAVLENFALRISGKLCQEEDWLLPALTFLLRNLAAATAVTLEVSLRDLRHLLGNIKSVQEFCDAVRFHTPHNLVLSGIVESRREAVQQLLSASTAMIGSSSFSLKGRGLWTPAVLQQIVECLSQWKLSSLVLKDPIDLDDDDDNHETTAALSKQLTAALHQNTTLQHVSLFPNQLIMVDDQDELCERNRRIQSVRQLLLPDQTIPVSVWPHMLAQCCYNGGQQRQQGYGTTPAYLFLRSEISHCMSAMRRRMRTSYTTTTTTTTTTHHSESIG